ncbi:hypothetical protein DRO33_01215, partial [Candidatus Bathyarchaeota archaeon]
AKRAIFAIHKGELDKARELLDQARKELGELRELLLSRPDVASLSILNPAYQEYSEAELLLAFVSGSEPPGPEELGVPPDQYLLGLADVIGELRRRALEALRGGRLEDAERSLELMEDIYMELISLDEAQAILSELRRKCDVGRRLIEATRGDIALEARRLALEKAMRELEAALEAKHQA